MNGLKCLKQIRVPAPFTFAYFIGNYVFPIVFSIGVVGNILNLIVLRKMKSKTVYFLSAMVMADICFFLVMFVLNLPAYDSLATNLSFLKFYFQSKMILLSLANWFSSASIWFIIMVTVERLVAIRTPFLARSFWKHRRIITIIIMISLSTLLLQIPYFLWLKPGMVPDCDHPNKTTHVLVQMDVTYPMYTAIKYAIIICPLITVFIPMILLISLNSLLLYHLRSSRQHIRKLGGLINRSNSCSINENEFKIAMMILIIVFTFFVFNFPSVVIYIYLLFETSIYRMSQMMTPAITTNYMVTLSKALNFPLYCCTSANFRTQLKKLIIPRKQRKIQKSSETDYTKC